LICEKKFSRSYIGGFESYHTLSWGWTFGRVATITPAGRWPGVRRTPRQYPHPRRAACRPPARHPVSARRLAVHVRRKPFRPFTLCTPRGPLMRAYAVGEIDGPEGYPAGVDSAEIAPEKFWKAHRVKPGMIFDVNADAATTYANPPPHPTRPTLQNPSRPTSPSHPKYLK